MSLARLVSALFGASWLGASACCLSACSGGSTPASASSFTTLASTDWSLDAGKETYLCAVSTVPEDMLIHAFRPIAPVGTHHTVVTWGDAAPDGVYECDVNDFLPNLIYASGVGTEDYTLPDGVGVRLGKGQKIHLQLHLFNAQTHALTGRSGVEVARMPESELANEAEFVLAGTDTLSLPPGPGTASGTCTMAGDVTIFGLWPHMHRLGVHEKATAKPADGAPSVIWDGAFSFDDQRFYDQSPLLALKAGDQVVVDCSYENTTATTVHWGESSTAEMCFFGLYRYPKVAKTPTCTH